MLPNEGLRLLRKKMDEHGLFTWTAKLNTNKNRLGVCKYQKRRLELSIHHVRNGTDAAVLNTILHEIAHALVGVQYVKVPRRRKMRRELHGPAWKQKAIEIGCTGERCGTMHVPTTVIGTCTDCGYQYHRHRMPKKRQHYHTSCYNVGAPNKGLLSWTRK